MIRGRAPNGRICFTIQAHSTHVHCFVPKLWEIPFHFAWDPQKELPTVWPGAVALLGWRMGLGVRTTYALRVDETRCLDLDRDTYLCIACWWRTRQNQIIAGLHIRKQADAIAGRSSLVRTCMGILVPGAVDCATVWCRR